MSSNLSLFLQNNDYIYTENQSFSYDAQSLDQSIQSPSLSLSPSKLLGNKDESAVDKNNGAVWGSVGHYGSVWMLRYKSHFVFTTTPDSSSWLTVI